MAFFITGAQRMCVPVLFEGISADLNLSLVQLGAIWGVDPLAGFFISIPGGMIIDKFGVKRTAIAVCLLGGLFGALRGFSVDFFSMAFITFIFGFTATMTLVLAPKVVAIWFKHHRLGLANAVFMISVYAGQMFASMSSATVLLPLFGNWRNVLIILSMPAILIGILWFFTASRPGDRRLHPVESEGTTLLHLLSHVIRIKDIWIMGLVVMCGMGTILAVNGYLPIYLQGIGWSVAEADFALTLMLGFSLIGNIPIMFFADRLKSLKPMFIISLLVMAVSLGLIIVADKPGVWALLVVYGLARAVPPTLVNIYIIKLPQIGGKYTGTAVGLANTVGMLGGFYIPPAAFLGGFTRIIYDFAFLPLRR